jgi:hypothetical protein
MIEDPKNRSTQVVDEKKLRCKTRQGVKIREEKEKKEEKIKGCGRDRGVLIRANLAII